ncbi:hypothetical protein D3C87_782650 [compost metagenome]
MPTAQNHSWHAQHATSVSPVTHSDAAGRVQNRTCAILKSVYDRRMMQEKAHGGKRPGSGRKPLQEGVPTIPTMIRLTEPQRDKLKRLGGATWVRDKIDKAKEPQQ